MSDSSHELYKETQAAKALLANLKDIIGEDAEFAADIVDGETNLNEAIDAAVRQLIDDNAASRGLGLMITDLEARRQRIDRRIANFRTAIACAMEQAGRKKIEHHAVTLTLKAVAPSVTVTDEALIPSKYFLAQDPKLSKKAVLEALKAKEEVPGATLNNGGSTLQARFT
jgi:hypothetical protein